MAARSHSSAPGSPGVYGVAGLVILVVVAAAVTSFAWPAARLKPRELPLGVAGPAQATRPVQERLARQHGAFELHRYADAAAARHAIEQRDVYAAIVASPRGITLLTASAASPAVAQLLEQTIAASAHPTGGAGRSGEPPPRVVDVVAADSNDPRGAALGALVLPLTLVSTLIALIVMTVTRPGPRQAAGLIAGAALAGLVAIAIVQGWLGIIRGPWLLNGPVLILAVLAICSTVTGLTALLGLPGLELAAALMVFAGNPWSGVSAAPELLPEPIGTIGQLLPPGAGGNLLRSTAFFDGAGAGSHLTVLLAWAAFGLAAVTVGALRHRQTSQVLPEAIEPLVARRG